MKIGAEFTRASIRLGYYWCPTLKSEATTFVQRCQAYQLHSTMQQRPTSTWAQYHLYGGDYISSAFPSVNGLGSFHLYNSGIFQKVGKRTNCKNYARYSNKIHLSFYSLPQLGVLRHILTNNGFQFSEGKFSRMCEKLGTQLYNSSVYQHKVTDKSRSPTKLSYKGLKK